MYSKIISIEELLDWYLKTLEIKLDRKPIQRYIKNENQNVDKDKLAFDSLIENILDSIELSDEKKIHFGNVLENFIEVYKCFTQYIEVHNTSQKQLNFLLAKDMIIPFFALFSSYVFDKNIIILEQIKPDENKKSFQKFLDWAEINICQQSIKEYLLFKHTQEYYEEDDILTDIERNITNWLSLKKQTTPNNESLIRLVKYLKDCNRVTHLNLYNLALFSKVLQEIHKKLENLFDKNQIELLIEHYYILLKFYSIKLVSNDIEETEYKIYNELLNHINPLFINRNHYFDDYFAWIDKVVIREYFTPYKLIKKVFNKNGLFYLLPELECMKYIEINLPIFYFNKTKPQNEYCLLFNEMISRVPVLNINTRRESINLQSDLFFIYLDNQKQKNVSDKVKCNEIFKKLEIEFNINDSNPYICFLKTKFYIFDNNLEESLLYCEKCINLGIGKLGEHFKEIVMIGILLSAKLNKKTNYNFFRRIAIKYDTLFLGKLKIPSYGVQGEIVDIYEDKSSFEKLKREFDKYFSNKFS
ncbi:hypothetical protein [Aliarcobacter butzleri]|uniref:hypothetical protein n=1 Tax=Aliarcobacter butzleri TaxID=28197 RepID=UPI0021B29FEF|nr:hypothetical protein [Aliarcobacter butzleri]MCT7619408.1 hypothetical protein [Aliarcobacter butzleri]